MQVRLVRQTCMKDQSLRLIIGPKRTVLLLHKAANVYSKSRNTLRRLQQLILNISFICFSIPDVQLIKQLFLNVGIL